MGNLSDRAFVALLVVCTIAVPAMPHEHATGIVKERMALMEGIGKRMKAINARIRNRQHLAAIKDDARAIAESATHIVHLFPPGSTQPPTEARAAIWQNFADFEAKANALTDESTKLAEVDAADAAALSAQVRALSQSCSNCHEIYRAKK